MYEGVQEELRLRMRGLLLLRLHVCSSARRSSPSLTLSLLSLSLTRSSCSFHTLPVVSILVLPTPLWSGSLSLLMVPLCSLSPPLALILPSVHLDGLLVSVGKLSLSLVAAIRWLRVAGLLDN